jgi:phosphoglycolate phosphatase
MAGTAPVAVDAIFFDVDGTLVDARADIADAVNYTLKKLGLDEKPCERISSYVGTGVRDLIKKSLGPEKEKLVDSALRIFSDYYVSHSYDKAILYPHVKEVLEYFKQKRKFILTNRYSRFAEITLKGLGIRDYFEAIMGGDDENCLKPSACVMEPILPKFGIDKDRAIIIGDMDIDIMTGKNAGIKTCFVTYGLGRKEDAAALNPDYVIDDLIELEKIIK